MEDCVCAPCIGTINDTVVANDFTIRVGNSTALIIREDGTMEINAETIPELAQGLASEYARWATLYSKPAESVEVQKILDENFQLKIKIRDLKARLAEKQ